MKKYLKDDIIDILIVLGVLAVGLFIFVGHQGHMLIDNGREVYFPVEVLKGKVLYKDIFNIYGPLSYQVNALLYFIFGQKLSSLYLGGIVSSVTIIMSLFLITKEVATSRIAKAVSYFIIAACVCNSFIFNFVFPYSYAVSYSLASFMAALLFLVYYIKTDHKKFIYMSAFLTGMSLTFKYEYTLFLAVFAFVVFYLKPLKIKELFYTFLSFILVPLVSYGVLFAQGLTFADIINSFSIMKKMLAAPSLKFLYQNTAGFYPNPTLIVFNIISFIKNSLIFLFTAGVIYFVSIVSKKEESNISKKAVNYLPMVLLALIFPYKLFFSLAAHNAYGWLPLTTLAIVISAGFEIYKAKGFKNATYKQNLFFLLSLCAVLSSIKSFWFLNIYIYGPFILPLVFMINVVFLTEKIPERFNFIDKEHLNKVISFLLIVLSILLFRVNMQTYQNVPLETSKGTIYTSKSMAYLYKELISYTNNNIPRGAKILVMPEGPMINFFTDHPSDDIYHSLLPIYIETFGEDKIIADFTKNKPDYIFMNNRNSADYGHALICRDYATKLCNFIIQNYTLEKVFQDDTKFVILKKKS